MTLLLDTCALLWFLVGPTQFLMSKEPPPMTRDRWMEKLETIISRVEAGEAPARIREIHVFGSFARGAIEPNDLDLIVIHDRPSREVLAPLLQAVKSYSYDNLDQSFKAY